MREGSKNYFKNLANLMESFKVTDREGNETGFHEGVEMAGRMIMEKTGEGQKLIFIGNGASAAISSHMATDFWKNGGMRAMAFNDGILLTCIGNDYGYRHSFEKPVEMFADRGDLLMAVSSSGQSENIILAIRAARTKGLGIITFSGFEEDNPLSSTGDLNFYVPSNSYGPVEILHQAIIHCILDLIIDSKTPSR